eukprot:5257601-Amphidinium_carterae.1
MSCKTSNSASTTESCCFITKRHNHGGRAIWKPFLYQNASCVTVRSMFCTHRSMRNNGVVPSCAKTDVPYQVSKGRRCSRKYPDKHGMNQALDIPRCNNQRRIIA